jgi:hypothetical protein
MGMVMPLQRRGGRGLEESRKQETSYKEKGTPKFQHLTLPDLRLTCQQQPREVAAPSLSR